ncbi:uncharacterized protein [Littorina saxatilis]|uniref:uncharacterized protein isoform X2 n=1 Tax=Littorina saxatilis TaxID=31220 RepID=UPI0038B4FC56
MNIDVLSNQPTSVTCTGLRQGQHIYWSITKEGIETRIGNCTRCTPPPCENCSVFNGNYSVIRQPTNTTLRLKANVNANNTSVLKCSNNINRFSAVCNVIIIEAYNLPRCNDAVLQIYEKGKTMVECTGLHPLQIMYWSILFDNGTEERLAECSNCKGKGIACPACNISNGDYNVTREATSSVLRLDRGDDSSKDGATLKCSKRDNATAAACKLRVSNYTLPQCQNGHLKVSAVSPWTPIQCEDLDPSQRVNWTITDTYGTVLHIASCDTRNEGYNCMEDNDDFIVSRISDSASKLKIVKTVEEKNFYTITCERRDGAAAASCLLQVDHGLMQDQGMTLLSTIGGSVGATVFVVVVVIVALIIIRKRRVADRPSTLPTIPESSSERTSSTGEYIEIIAGELPSDAEVTGAPYGSLQMSDVNVPSVYSEITRSTNESAESYGARYANATR